MTDLRSLAPYDMFDDDIVLRLGLAKGRNADAVVAAESLLAWVDLARDAARAIDPYADVRVELLGRAEGSLKQFLRLVDDHAATISAGADQYPHLKKFAIGLAVAIATAGLNVAVERTLVSGVQTVELSDRDRDLLRGMTHAVSQSTATAKNVQRFYRTLDRDPAITDVTVALGPTRPPLLIVERPEFAMRGGLYSQSEEDVAEEARREVWSVVLMQAPFYKSSRRWGFSRDGVSFSAQMNDAIFLQAIEDGTIPISLRAGVRMEVEVEWQERRRGKVWEYRPGTRRITRVLWPRPAIPD